MADDVLKRNAKIAAYSDLPPSFPFSIVLMNQASTPCVRKTMDTLHDTTKGGFC